MAIGWNTGGGGGITQITSDSSLLITNPAGPIVTITATAASVGADVTGAAAAAVAAHVALPDPHTQYTEKGWVAYQFSDTGNRGPGSGLRSGGDLFGNITPGSSIGQASVAGIVRAVAWRRDVTVAGSWRISSIDNTPSEVASVLVTAAALQRSGSVAGLSLPVDGAVGVLWDSTSSGTTQNPSVTVYVELT